ncbi:hypothetical protein AUK40_01965 [Candidatus Wirthbacteria bacterium CG2_30_54_11]|uniref:EamA domain-containing protein n=1 Tax=Candidatus Wirthbacteria bacterium CG2_30_54_11 TaxID=1817892 RepID=A0A1J5IM36_9BACT|nr:MAG: hypothetical protein AUK40_01965 [Candidatus Wirthbacteria bacterium CG2_30_54_11]
MPSHHRTSSAVLALIILTAIIGSGFGPIAKIALRTIPPMSFIFLRFVIATILLAPSSVKKLPAGRPLLQLMLVSLLATANTILFAFGISDTTASISQMLYASLPLMTTLITIVFLHHRINRRATIGISIGFLGTALILVLPMLTTGQASLGGIRGNLTIFVSVITYTVYCLASERFHDRFSVGQIVFIFSLVSLIISAPLTAVDLISNPAWWNTVPPAAYVGLLYAGSIGTVLFYYLSQLVVKKSNPVTASVIQYIQPFMTFVWAALLLGERLTIVFIIAVICTLAGVYLTTSAESGEHHTLPPTEPC